MIDGVRTRHRYAELQGCSGHYLRILALQEKICQDYEKTRCDADRIGRQHCDEEDFVCVRHKALIRRIGGIGKKGRSC